MKDFVIDPATGDFVRGTDGWFATTESAATAVYYQLTHEYDASWAQPERGIRDLKQLGDGDVGQQFAAAETERALGVLADEGRISNVTVTTSRSAPGRILDEVSYIDTATGQVFEVPSLAGAGG
jgi:phage gp46-like protein